MDRGQTWFTGLLRAVEKLFRAQLGRVGKVVGDWEGTHNKMSIYPRTSEPLQQRYKKVPVKFILAAYFIPKVGFTRGKISADICAENCASWSVLI
jgi:hypothetical protein